MKKALFILFAILLMNYLFAEQSELFKYDDSWAEAGFNLVTSSNTEAEIIYSIEEFIINQESINGIQQDVIYLPGNFLPNEAGAPNLPGEAKYIAIPVDSEVDLKIVEMRTELFSDITLAPAPRIPLETEEGPLEYPVNSSIYEANAFYPEEPVILSEKTQIRGLDVVLLGITPFRYNPVSKELIAYRDIKIKLDFRFGTGEFGEERLRNRWWDPIYQQVVLNADILPQINYNRQSNSRTEDFEYLIITPDHPDFIAWADSIRIYRTKQGIRTGIATITEVGGNTTTAIENYVNDAYYNWDIAPVAVLLLGDYGSSNTTITSPMWYGGYNPCVSDNIYADIMGNDLPDLTFARITAQNANQLETMINKFIEYELNPPVEPDVYNYPLMAGGWQTERWFILCTEIVQGYMANVLGKEPIREYAIYDGTPGYQWSTASNTSTIVNYFGPNGLGYIPATPDYLNDWGGNAFRINTDINNGTFMILHRDHGYEDGWGEPAYTTANLNSLSNEVLPFVFSVNCLTGKYNVGGQCFAEAFHRHQQGALGVIAASEVSYSFVNDTYVWGMFDHMWNDFDPFTGVNTGDDILPAFANVSGKYYLQGSGWPSNSEEKDTVHYLFHHHGDAFSTVYSEVPQELFVQHDPVLLSGVNFFEVNADEGSLIAITVNDEILGVDEGTGYPLAIGIEPQLPGNYVTITVTKQNYFRYSQQIQVIPPEGPYVVYQSCEINDENGNNNGVLDYDESVYLSLTVENVGLELGENIEISIQTEDEYLTLVDSTEFYGNIEAGNISNVANGFGFYSHDNIPDEHTIIFTLEATDGENLWESTFTLEAYAPLLMADDYIIEDPDGDNDGILDPGENVTLLIPNLNIGHSLSPEATAFIACSDEGLTFDYFEYELGEIEADGSVDAIFYLSASEDIQIGTPFYLTYNLIAGQYTTENEYTLTVGLCLEDFETGDFSSFPWEFNGVPNWYISDVAYEGDHCARSGGIGDGQSSSLTIQMYVLDDNEISFYKKVSSEATYDFMRFYIDNNEIDSWSGESAWSQVTYQVTEGDHTFKWEYDKDGSVSNGSDCGWIDYVIFPPNAIGATGFIEGTIITDPPGEYENAIITTGEYTVNADETGHYILEIPYGTYDVTASLQGYESITDEDVEVPPFEIITIDFNLPFIAPPHSLIAEAVNENIVLTWSAPETTLKQSQEKLEQKTRINNRESRVLQYYKVYRNIDEGSFSFLFATTATTYTDDDIPGAGIYGYYVTAVYTNNSESDPSNTVYVVFTDIGEEPLPAVTKLHGNFPNPFNPETVINFSLKENGQVNLNVYNLKGERIRTLVAGEIPAGDHSVIWSGDDDNGNKTSSGLYIYKLTAPDYTSVKKMILMK